MSTETWSDPFPVVLKNVGPWEAYFICGPRSHHEAGQPAPYFRRDFRVDPGLRAATLHVTGLGIIETHLNGEVVGDEVLCPGWTSYDNRLVASTHEVTDLLHAGINTVGAIVGEGWAVGRLADHARRNLWSDRPAAFVELHLDYGDRTEVVGTDKSWRTSTGAVLSDGIYDGETYDARLHPRGWDEAGFDDSDWTPVAVVVRDRATIVPRKAPPIRRTEERPALSVYHTPLGATVIDFGQILSGWVRISLDGPPGTTVTLRHCELLVDGEPEFETNRGALATDRYTKAADGTEVWEPRFTFHGFRYVVVDGWPTDPSPDDFTAVVVHSDLRRTGWFECSDERINQLHRNVVWSWRGNSVGLPTDCPQRDERLGWTGDINAFAPTAAFLYDVQEFLGSWLEDLAAEQRAIGQVPYVVPHVLSYGTTGPTALWGDVAVSLPWALYQEYGDIEILQRQYPSMCAFVDSVIPMLDDEGLWTRGFQFGDWLDPDAPPTNAADGKTEAHLMASAYLCRSTAELAQTAELLQRPEEASRYRELHDRVRAAFRWEWVTPAGRVANETATAYALAICFGLLDREQESRAGERLAELVSRAGFKVSTGFAGTPWVAHALTRTGQLDYAYRLLMQTESPSFLYPISMGATTIWERWDAVFPDGRINATGMTSLNHYALGAVANWLHRVVAGITPTAPGYRSVRIAPRPGGGLTWATAAHESPHGRVEVSWRTSGGDRTVDVAVPEGVTAEVVLPGHPENLVLTVGGGDHHWKYEIEVERGPTLDTPWALLRADPPVWRAIGSVIDRLFPGSEGIIEHVAAAVPHLRSVITELPGDPAALERDLCSALADPLSQLDEPPSSGATTGTPTKVPPDG